VSSGFGACGLAGRPGELGGIGPVDPGLARDLAAAAARNPRTTWCVTVTDRDGHAIGHGCARPDPKTAAKHKKPGPAGGHDPPRDTGDTPVPGLRARAAAAGPLCATACLYAKTRFDQACALPPGPAPPLRHQHGLPQLRNDLDRFTFLLGGNDGEPLFQPGPLSALRPPSPGPSHHSR
jgi:hypothetical protein